MKDATLCFLVRNRPARDVLLGLKKTGLGAGKYTGLGGKVEDGETTRAAAVRELYEEAGVLLPESALQWRGHVTFIFPVKPAWDFAVDVYLAEVVEAAPVESVEIRPGWFRVEAIPYAQMWQDAAHWLPLVLEGKRVRARFVYGNDNESLVDMQVEQWRSDDTKEAP